MVALRLIIGVAAAIALTIVTWALLSVNEHRKNADLITTEAENARDLIAHDLNVRLKALDRLGHRMAAAQYVEEKQFTMDVVALFRDMPGFFAIAWVGTDNRIALVEPERSKRLLGKNLKSLGPERVALAEQARASRVFHIGDHMDLVNNNGQGFVVAKSVRRNGQHIGTIWVVFQVNDWVENLYFGANQDVFETLNLSISMNGSTLYKRSDDMKADELYTHSTPVMIADAAFSVGLSPKPQFFHKPGLNLQHVVTVLVAILSGALSVAAYALRSSRRQQDIAITANEDLRKVNDQLKNEVDHRRAAEDAARRSNAAKSQFMSTMSHEMRTPMNGILGTAELLCDTKLSKAQADHMEALLGCAHDLMENVSDILDFAKFEVGPVVLKQDPCDLGKVVSEAVQLLRHFAQKKGLELHSEISAQVPPLCLADKNRFRQVVLNLIRNGIKFTEHGSVHVSLSVSKDDQLVLSVADTGMGIAKSELRKIFQAFEQVDGASDRKFEGSGLGLSITDRIVTSMGGVIKVDSKPGEGSNFIIKLPYIAVEKPIAGSHTHSTSSAPNRLLNGASILLAEDNLVNQKIVQGYIKGSGIRLDVAGDGNEAMRLFAAGQYDAVLMDVSMPNRNGFDATRAIRELEQRRAAQSCPIIGYTANCGEEDQQKCYAAGMDDVLPKPATKKELSDRLAHWVAKKLPPENNCVVS